MPDSAERAVELLRTICPDAIQLHGEWTPDEIRFIRAETERKVLLAVDADDPARAEEFDRVADALVIDSTDDSGAGGTGETHDWNEPDLARPTHLAGGPRRTHGRQRRRSGSRRRSVRGRRSTALGRRTHRRAKGPQRGGPAVANAGREMELA